VHGVVRVAAACAARSMHLELYEAGRAFPRRREVLHLEQTPLPYLPDCRVAPFAAVRRVEIAAASPSDIVVPDSAYIPQSRRTPPAERFAIPIVSLRAAWPAYPAPDLPRPIACGCAGTVVRSIDRRSLRRAGWSRASTTWGHEAARRGGGFAGAQVDLIGVS